MRTGSTSAARVRWAVELADGVQDLAWSPDGRAIALSVGDDLDIWVYYLE